MDKCKNCGQDLDIRDKFCRNCGQALGQVGKNSQEPGSGPEKTIVPRGHKKPRPGDSLVDSEKTIIPVKAKGREDNILDPAIIERAREEKIRRDIEETLNTQEEDREYKDYELAETRVIGNISQYMDQAGEDQEDYDDYEDEEDWEDHDDWEDQEESRPSRLWMGLGLMGLLVLIVFSSFFLTRRKGLGKDQLIADFLGALEARDEAELIRLLDFGEGQGELDSRDLAGYFRYIDENPKYLEKLSFALEEQAKLYDGSQTEETGEIQENIVLKKKGRGYYLEAKPYYIRVGLPKPEAELYLGHERIDFTGDGPVEIGPLMPGIYDLSSRLDGEEVQEKVLAYVEKPEAGRQFIDVDLDLNFVSLRLESNFKDSNIIINGEDSKVKVQELEGGILGPLSRNTRIQLVQTTPFGKFRSREFDLAQLEGESLRLDISFKDPGLEEALTGLIASFLDEDARAKEKLDPSLYSSLMEPELSRRTKLIGQLEEYGQRIETRVLAISYDRDSLEVSRKDGNYYARISARLDLEETYLTDISTETKPSSNYLNYSLIYMRDSRSWKLMDIGQAESFSQANTRDHNF